jgi:DNA-binding transcriptional LysR family regulator
MTLQQLRFVRETVRQGLNLTEAAHALHVSQPGISKQIKDLESELGVQLFARRGKRFTGLTESGKAIVEVVERLLREADNLRETARECAGAGTGSLTIATTHTQARYALPRVVHAFRARYPDVRLALMQGSPNQIAALVVRGEADLAIATEALDQYPELLALPGYHWNHSVIVPAGHPLADSERVALEDLARYPIVTYSTEFAGRGHIDRAFRAKGLVLDPVLAALDADVIKTYVEMGLGVGIIAAMAFDPLHDRALRALDAGHLFESNTTRVAVRRGAYLRGYVYDFIELFSPQLTRDVIRKTMAGTGAMYEL